MRVDEQVRTHAGRLGEGHVDVVHALLAKGANIDLAKNDGATPLFIASQNGLVDVVHALLAKGANIDLASNKGVTPLIVAVGKKHFGVVRALLQNDAYEPNEE